MSLRRLWLIPWVVGCLAFGLSRPAAAQTFEISGGYSYLRDTRLDVNFARGWTLGVGRKLRGAWAIAEVDGQSTTLPFLVGDAQLTLTGILGGGRMAAKIGPFTEFVQVLGGVVRGSGITFDSKSHDVRGAAQVGGGLDAPLSKRIKARVQIDGRSLRNEDWKIVEVRLAAGLVCVF